MIPRTAVFTPDEPYETAVYLLSSREDAAAVWALLKQPKAYLVSIEVPDWNRDLSPWPSPKVFKGGEAFAGGADAFLQTLLSDVLPDAEAQMKAQPVDRYLAGVSLAGLFAIYALYRTDRFTAVASVSGSFWYDGFVEYMEQHQPQGLVQKVYLSVGDRERMTRNQRLAAVEDNTRRAAQLLQSSGIHTCFELNEGNHFANGGLRMQSALAWLLT